MSVKLIAEKAGVSTATVSRILNGAGNVKSETREHVLNIARELGYDEFVMKKSRLLSDNNVITLMLHDVHKPFYTQLLYHFQDYIRGTDYRLMIASTLEGRTDTGEFIREMFRFSSGIILFSSFMSDKSITGLLRQNQYPMVVIDNQLNDAPVSTLMVDNRAASEQVVQYLAGLGHRKIACLAGSPNLMVWVERLNGYINAMHRQNLYIDNNYIRYATDADNGVEEAIHSFCTMEPSVRPTAIYCFCDSAAYQAVDTIQRLGLNVPEQISVIGFDDQQFVPRHYRGPSITSVRQPFDLLARDSIRLVIEQIEGRRSGRKVESVTRYYDTELVPGESSGPPPR